MPRDVLTLDVELDPASISRVRDQFRAGLSSDLTGSLPGIMGGPYGGMSPQVPGFPGQSFGQTVGQAIFPGFFAPPTAFVSDFERSSQFYRERAFGDFAFNAGQGVAELGGELAGGGLGAAAGGALGFMFGGKAGGYLGAAAGGLFGATLGGGAVSALGDEAQSIREGNKNIQNALSQLGFKAGLNILGEENGADLTRDLSYRIAGDAARNPLVAMTGMDPREFAQGVLKSGLQNNLFGQFDGGDPEQQAAAFQEEAKKVMSTTARVMQALHVTRDEALQMMADLKRSGANDPEQMVGEMGLLSASFQFGTDPSQLAVVGSQGSSLARQSNLPGFFGRREATVQGLRLAEMRQNGFLSEEVVQAGGGIGNLTAGIQSGVNRQLGQGGVLRDLLFASMSEGGGIDTKRFSELSGKSALEIRQESARQFYSGGDPIKKLEEFNYNMPDLLNQIATEDPGAVSRAFDLQVNNAAGIQARITGRGVTNATRFSAAQQFFGLDPNTARAFVQSRGASAADDPNSLIERSLTRADRDLVQRSRDPGVQLRMLTSGIREEVAAPAVQRAEQGVVDIQRYFGGKLKGLAASVLGNADASPEDKQRQIDDLLTQYNKELEEGTSDPNAPEAAKQGLKKLGVSGLGGAGKDALAMLAGQGGSVINLLNDIKNSMVSFLARAKSDDAKKSGGLNSATKSVASGTSPATGG